MSERGEEQLVPYPGELWSERVAAARSDDDRRELVGEAMRWRVQHLDDGPAMRRATYAIARLLAQVGERDRAVGEARQLLSLLQTASDATDEELHATRSLLGSLGQAVPRTVTAARRPREWERGGNGVPRSARPERPPRGITADPRPGPANGLAEARRAAAREDYDAALGLIEGQRQAGALLLRAYIQVSRSAASPDPAAALAALRIELARAAGIVADTSPSDPLAQLFGGPVPTKRLQKIRVIEEFAAAHPDRLDELGAAALRHHLLSQGPTVPAPWLVGIVGGALGRGGEHTRAAIDELRAASAVAVLAYDEWPFERLVRLRTRAEALGYSVESMRRGILARGEPDERKVWTLRLDKDGVQGMIAVAPHATVAYPPGMADELGPRLKELCPRTLLLASGFGNAGLRSAAAAAGLAVREHDADDDALLAVLVEIAPPPAGESRPTTLAGAPVDLAGLLTAEEEPSLEAVVTALRGFRRLDRAMRIVQKLPLDDARSALVLGALPEVAEKARPHDVITFAIAAAARGPRSSALVTGELGTALIGVGAEPVIEIAGSLQRSGWDVHRILRGPTKREMMAHPALDTLAASMSSLWRLLVRQGARKGEVWFVGELPPEGRAGVPLLLLEDWQRVVLLPVDAELLGWWRTLHGPEPLVWSGTEDEALRAGVEGFIARSDPDRAEPGAEAEDPGA